jgi:glutamyl-tRNA synthetase
MANFLALLGWSPGGDREVMTIREMVALFSAEGLLRKSSIFDPRKLAWMNGQHLSMVPLEQLDAIVAPLLVAAGLSTGDALAQSREWWYRLLDLLRVRARTTHDIVRQAAPYFRETVDYDPEAIAKLWRDRATTTGLLRAVRQRLEHAEWSVAALERELQALAAEQNLAIGAVLQPLRVALTGVAASPGIYDVLDLLGRARSLRRVDTALEMLNRGE